MNLLLVESLSSEPLSIRGAKAKELLSRHKFSSGNFINVGLRNGTISKAEIISLSDEEICLRLCKESKQLLIEDVRFSLLLALPRPQTLKKVFEFAGSIGIYNIYLTGAKRVEKSYFNSHLLKKEEQVKYLELGMQQGVSTRKPEVFINHSLKNTLTNIIKENPNANLFLAHPYVTRSIAEVDFNPVNNGITEVVLAIGPEAGWDDVDILEMEKIGFRVFTSGSRILRVEYAVCALVSQLQLLFELRSKIE